MIEITNVTPEKAIKLLWHIAVMLTVIILSWRLPDLILAIKA